MEFWDHPKTVKLERRLGLEGVKALQVLWAWSAKNKPDGVLSGMDEEDIEIAAGWKGNDGELLQTLIELRWVDKDASGYALHDWKDHNDWAAKVEDREDRGRFSRLKQVAPNIHKMLSDQGVTAISKEYYDSIVAERRPIPQGTPGVSPGSAQGTPGVSPGSAQGTPGGQPGVQPAPGPGPGPGPAPAPVPAPVPTPVPTPETTPPTPPTGGKAAAGEASPEPQEDGAVKVAEVAELWNAELCPLGFPRVSKITPDRRKHFRARLRDGAERRELAWWRDRIAAIAGSDFMRKSAAEKAPWLTFDWLLNETNLVKVAEDKYGHGLNLSRGQPLKQGSQPMDEYLRELQKDPFWGDSGGDETCSSEIKLSSQPA